MNPSDMRLKVVLPLKVDPIFKSWLNYDMPFNIYNYTKYFSDKISLQTRDQASLKSSLACLALANFLYVG